MQHFLVADFAREHAVAQRLDVLFHEAAHVLHFLRACFADGLQELGGELLGQFAVFCGLAVQRLHADSDGVACQVSVKPGAEGLLFFVVLGDGFVVGFFVLRHEFAPNFAVEVVFVANARGDFVPARCPPELGVVADAVELCERVAYRAFACFGVFRVGHVAEA